VIILYDIILNAHLGESMKNRLSKISVIFILIIIANLLPNLPADAVTLRADTKKGNNVTEGSETYDYSLYLPVILTGNNGGTVTRRINLPYFETMNMSEKYSQMAVAWFGRVGPTDNYADIRAGYNSEELFISLNIFDRLLWYDVDPSRDELTDWDSATLFVDLESNSGGSPDINSYRFGGPQSLGAT
jgi:hypothetical protein